MDWSQITTKELEYVVKRQDESKKQLCLSIDCGSCPWGNNCFKSNKEERRQSFRDELKRRKTEMIYLEVGMVIEYEGKDHYMVMPDTGGGEGFIFINNEGLKIQGIDNNLITRVFRSKGMYNYVSFFDGKGSSKYYDLLWERESSQDIKLKELEDTIKKAQEKIEEIRNNGRS